MNNPTGRDSRIQKASPAKSNIKSALEQPTPETVTKDIMVPSVGQVNAGSGRDDGRLPAGGGPQQPVKSGSRPSRYVKSTGQISRFQNLYGQRRRTIFVPPADAPLFRSERSNTKFAGDEQPAAAGGAEEGQAVPSVGEVVGFGDGRKHSTAGDPQEQVLEEKAAETGKTRQQPVRRGRVPPGGYENL